MRVVEAVLLSAVVAFVLYSGRYRLREVRWLRRVKPGSGIPLTYWQMGSFLLAVGLIVGTATLERAWADGSLTLWQSLLLHILVSLIGICLTISWTLTVVGGYLSGLDERVPQPIFMDMNTLSDLALDAAGSRLGVRSWEILAIQRTNDGGLKINVRQKGTKKTASAAAKAATGTARTSWTVVCDRWGRLRSVLPNQGSVL